MSFFGQTIPITSSAYLHNVLQNPHFYMQNRNKPDKSRRQVGKKRYSSTRAYRDRICVVLKPKRDGTASEFSTPLNSANIYFGYFVISYLIAQKQKHRLKI